MNCIVDIKKEGSRIAAMLPFDPRIEFCIPKGSIYVRCAIENREFSSKLMSRGEGKYCIFFSKALLKDIGVADEKSGVQLRIEPDISTSVSGTVKNPEIIDNATIKCILERASVRRFTDKEIAEVEMNTLLYAGFSSPSANNKRPFHFCVSKDKDKMARMIGDNHYVKMLANAAACIVVCGNKILQGIPEWLIEDCSAATQNILLAIHAIGLGGVWCGIKQGSEFYKIIVAEFGLPNHIRPISIIAFGYPSEEKTQPDRFEMDKIHFESW